eukprot:CAMPEP_0115863264 /NCGR_PEP_ID=MMETSP0287-20121206/18602_1 /TAXON_ID=412157 /ORGANISM="Chrysochromulina rotalis, Strain UIO044" /LENGTH=155 /DNA_ID=CAMNT_0003317711 /DNA_START=311 /DNA_END=776 /DNA_ORIENTATION=+
MRYQQSLQVITVSFSPTHASAPLRAQAVADPTVAVLVAFMAFVPTARPMNVTVLVSRADSVLSSSMQICVAVDMSVVLLSLLLQHRLQQLHRLAAVRDQHFNAARVSLCGKLLELTSNLLLHAHPSFDVHAANRAKHLAVEPRWWHGRGSGLRPA